MSHILLYGMGLASVGPFDIAWESRLVRPNDL